MSGKTSHPDSRPGRNHFWQTYRHPIRWRDRRWPAMNMISEGRAASRIWRKSEDERSNGQFRPVIYARLGTMHHASRCCRRRIHSSAPWYTIGRSARFELCIGQYVVHPLNHDDLQLSRAGHRYRCRLSSIT